MMKSLSQRPEVDIDLVKEWLREAGKIALSHFNEVEGTCKADRTLVTDADYDIEELLIAYLRATYPEHGIIGEEKANDVRGDCVWAIDPLDGTRSFLAGLPVWGVSIGLLWRWEPWLGVFHMPLLDDWYYSASPTSGAFWNDQPIRCPARDEWDENSLLCVPSDIHRRYHIDFPGITRALGSTAAHLCFVARGNAMAVLMDNPGIWDVTAGAAILLAAGGTVRSLDGTDVDLQGLLEGGTSQQPILGAHPLLIDRIAHRIRPRGAAGPAAH